jgi:hypothetical protein
MEKVFYNIRHKFNNIMFASLVWLYGGDGDDDDVRKKDFALHGDPSI